MQAGSFALCRGCQIVRWTSTPSTLKATHPCMLQYCTVRRLKPMRAATSLSSCHHEPYVHVWLASPAGRLECLHVLLGAGASVAKSCEGSPVLHLAVSIGALPHRVHFAAAAVKALLQHGAVPYERSVWTWGSLT